MIRIYTFLLAVSMAGATNADEAVTIPLKNVWAVNMPGTREIGEFESEEAAKKSIVTKTLQQIRDTWDSDQGMAVQGEGLKALEEFYRVRSETLPRNNVSAESPASLVFFTTGVGFHTQIRRIEKRGNDFTIQYRFVPPIENRGNGQYLAVVPVGRLSPGKYQVKVEQLPIAKQYVELGYEKALPRQISGVCKSFSFLVLPREVEQ